MIYRYRLLRLERLLRIAVRRTDNTLALKPGWETKGRARKKLRCAHTAVVETLKELA